MAMAVSALSLCPGFMVPAEHRPAHTCSNCADSYWRQLCGLAEFDDNDWYSYALEEVQEWVNRLPN